MLLLSLQTNGCQLEGGGEFVSGLALVTCPCTKSSQPVNKLGQLQAAFFEGCFSILRLLKCFFCVCLGVLDIAQLLLRSASRLFGGGVFCHAVLATAVPQAHPHQLEALPDLQVQFPHCDQSQLFAAGGGRECTEGIVGCCVGERRSTITPGFSIPPGTLSPLQSHPQHGAEVREPKRHECDGGGGVRAVRTHRGWGCTLTAARCRSM